MEKQTSVTSKPSGLKAFLGGLTALGIFVGLIILSNLDFSANEQLKAEIMSSDEILGMANDLETSEAELVSMTEEIDEMIASADTTEVNNSTQSSLQPTSGSTGDLVEITVSDVPDFSLESGVFFGDIPANVQSFGDVDGSITIFVEVPTLAQDGSYPVRLVTSTNAKELDQPFQFVQSSVSEDAAIENTTTLDTDNMMSTLPLDATEQEPVISTPAEITTATVQLTVPNNLQATATPEGISLIWEGDADNYNIYYGSQSGKYVHRLGSENENELVARNLQDGTIYFFTVTAGGTDGNESTPSNEASAIFSKPQTGTTAPTEPVFHASSPKPPQLSEQGPAEALLISALLSAGVVLWIYRKKILKSH